MLRLLFLIVVLLVIVTAGVAIFRSVRSARIDWAGIVFALVFVALAFYLRHITGMSVL